MNCEHCKSNIDSTDIYCSCCGNKIIIHSKERYCHECGTKLREDDNFCRKCGTKNKSKDVINTLPEEIDVSLEGTVKQVVLESEVKDVEGINEESIQETTEFEKPHTPSTKVTTHTNHFKNPILWIISISLLIVCNLFSVYIRQYSNDINDIDRNPSISRERSRIANTDIEDFEIRQDMTIFMQQSNSNMNGFSFFHDGTFYVAIVEGVVAYTNDFQDKEIILHQDVSYIHVDDTYLYYQGLNYNYYRMHLETKEEEMLLSNIFYPQHVDGMLYYQDDSDGESMYLYDFATQESTKLNSIRSFQSFIDTNRNSIYYIGREGDVFSIYRMDLDGQNNEIVVLGVGSTALNYDGNYLYYSKAGIITSYDVTAQEHKELIQGEAYEILLIDDNLVSWDYFGDVLRKVDEDHDGRVISTESIYYLQVIGEYFICWIPDGEFGTVYILDMDGNCAYLIEDYKLSFDSDYKEYDTRDDNNIFEL